MAQMGAAACAHISAKEHSGLGEKMMEAKASRADGWRADAAMRPRNAGSIMLASEYTSEMRRLMVAGLDRLRNLHARVTHARRGVS